MGQFVMEPPSGEMWPLADSHGALGSPGVVHDAVVTSVVSESESPVAEAADASTRLVIVPAVDGAVTSTDRLAPFGPGLIEGWLQPVKEVLSGEFREQPVQPGASNDWILPPPDMESERVICPLSPFVTVTEIE